MSSSETAKTLACPGCGQVQDASLTTCTRCGRTLASGPQAPLPPIPDGGLSAQMPAWLRDDAGVPPVAPSPAPRRVIPKGVTAASIDPATIIHPDDLPTWLRNLIRSTAPAAQAPAGATAMAAAELATPPAVPPPPATAVPDLVTEANPIPAELRVAPDLGYDPIARELQPSDDDMLAASTAAAMATAEQATSPVDTVDPTGAKSWRDYFPARGTAPAAVDDVTASAGWADLFGKVVLLAFLLLVGLVVLTLIR